MNLWSEFFVEGHAPEAVVLDLASYVEALPEFVGSLFGVMLISDGHTDKVEEKKTYGENTRIHLAEGNSHCTVK